MEYPCSVLVKPLGNAHRFYSVNFKCAFTFREQLSTASETGFIHFSYSY